MKDATKDAQDFVIQRVLKSAQTAMLARRQPWRITIEIWTLSKA